MKGKFFVASIIYLLACVFLLYAQRVDRPAALDYQRAPRLPAEAPPPIKDHLVVEKVRHADGTTIYCVRWEPCEVCRLSCVK